MLDHTLMLYGTGISDSNTHFYDDLPIALVGGTKAGIKGGRYVRYPQGTPLANLWVTVLEKLGLPVETFGDSTGPLGRSDGCLGARATRPAAWTRLPVWATLFRQAAAVRRRRGSTVGSAA